MNIHYIISNLDDSKNEEHINMCYDTQDTIDSRD